MERDRWLSLTVGGFVLAALALLAVAILSLSAQQGIWTARYRLTGYYENVGGLIPGAAVRLAGKGVGSVESVGFATRPDGKPAVRVVVQVDREVQERIRADSVAQISTVGLLGDQIVEITLGTESAPPLGDGDEIPTLSPFDLNVMVSRGSEALDSIRSLAHNLNAVVTDYRASTMGKRLGDTVDMLADIVLEVRKGEGMLHSLIYEPYQGSAVESIEGSLASLERILREIEDGEGVLHSLIYEAPSDQGVVIEMLEAGAKMNEILAKIDRGDGTLGLLVNDPTLHEELRLFLGGANRSTLVRNLVNWVRRAGSP